MSVLFRSQCKYDPDYCDLLIEHCREGHTFESFSGRIGVHPSTVYRWKNEHPEFDEAFEIGLRSALYYWEKVHDAAATGRSKGNAAAIIFKLKNTFRMWYKDRQEIDHANYSEIRVSTGINSDNNSSELPDVEGEIVRKNVDQRVKKMIDNKSYVDFETLQDMVLNESEENAPGDDIL